jgi:hypothetical protein
MVNMKSYSRRAYIRGYSLYLEVYTRNFTSLIKGLTTSSTHALSVKGVNIWNNLDSSLTTISAHRIFKKK